MKKRDQFPSVGRLMRLHYDPVKLNEFCADLGLLDFSKYNDLNLKMSSEFIGFVAENEFNYSLIGKKVLEGDGYGQFYATVLKDGVSRTPVSVDPLSMKTRIERLDRESPNYSPVADERNYTKRREIVTGYLAELLDSFKGEVTRTRFAMMQANFDIAAHIDYNTDYIIRFHLPILTNESCTFKIWRRGQVEEYHLPINGDIYFLNSGYKHSAHNCGTTPRLHLIIDVHGQEDFDNFGLEAIEPRHAAT